MPTLESASTQRGGYNPLQSPRQRAREVPCSPDTEYERIRPDQLRQVKPYRASRDDKPFRPCLRPLSTNRARVKFLLEDRPDARNRRYQQKWNKRQNITATNSSCFPPDTERKHDRQHDHRRLA